MRRYQLSGLEHVHMIRHVPRSYDMTRTHILHKGVNQHVDVVLRCSPKNFKKKKVAVSVVRSDKKAAAVRIRANARKGYVAVRKNINKIFEADRRAAAQAFEARYSVRTPGLDSLVHDMKNQIAAMAKKSSDYIDEQLRSSQAAPVTVPEKAVSDETLLPPVYEPSLVSPETEEILRSGGYRLPNRPQPENPYSVDYITHASDDEFHSLMDSLERSLDEVCRKYAVPPEVPEEQPVQAEMEEHGQEKPQVITDFSDYTFPDSRSVSVNRRQEVTADTSPDAAVESATTPAEGYRYSDEVSFKPAISFKEGGGHYVPEDELFDRELGRPGERYVPPAYLFDDDDAVADNDDGNDVVPLIPAPQEEASPAPYPQDEYVHEDYVQQQVFFPTEPREPSAGHYSPEEPDYAEPTMYTDARDDHSEEEEIPLFFPPEESNEPDFTIPGEEMPAPEASGEPDFTIPGEEMPAPEASGEPDFTIPEEEMPAPEASDEPDFTIPDEDAPPPMIFPDDDEDAPPPMIFPDDDAEYTPTTVSPDRSEKADNGAGGVIDRSGHTLYSRSGDQIRKVIGVIHGAGEPKQEQPNPNGNIEITYSDGNE